MEEVLLKGAEGVGADLQMDCVEEEREAQSPNKDGAEEHCSEALEEDTPFRVIPIPVPPVSSYNSQHNPTVKCSGFPLSFKLNGRLLPLLPGGAELKLHSHPGGSASGFITVQVHVPLTVHIPAGTQHINTTALLTTSSNTAPPPSGLTPIITGVVSGEAAQRVLSSHSVNFKCTPPVMGTKAPPVSSMDSPQTTPPASLGPAAPRKPLRIGQLGPVSPPNCLVCMSQYKLITELRGFMCLCSPAIAQSLKNLKKKIKKQRRRSRDKNKMSRTFREPKIKLSKTRPGPGPALAASKVVSPIQRTHTKSDDFLSGQFISPSLPSVTCSPQQDQSEPPPDLHGKLVIMVEDFYYGSAPGQRSTDPNAVDQKISGPYRCIYCPKTLHNNIKLMSHMQQHVSTMSLQDTQMDALSSCPHCFRSFFSPFKLQCHLEAVHSQYESTAKCKICELAFDSEPAFLRHMKSTHKPGEMPYVCQVCDFRSSFYSDLWSHFEQVHADSKHLLCQYCLRVLRSSTCFQQHFARHQRKHMFSCDKCRLHFLFVRERTEHKLLHHRTHIRPPQLSGLKPGTKVTVRTYSVVRGPENKDRLQQMAPCKVVDVDPQPPTQEAPKRKPVETLGPLLSTLSQESEATNVSCPSQRCVECLSSFQDFGSHFPSLVHCSLCRFITCCSISYANHMINNHATCRKKTQYHSIFQPEPRLSQSLRCASCMFTTCRGDVMANHLMDRPEHHCIMSTHPELSVGGDVTNIQPPETRSVTSSAGQGGGVFIPIHLLPSRHTSTQLSVKALTCPSSLSSPPAMTIKFVRRCPQAEQCPSVSPLSAFQLSVVLFSLCHGLSQASRRYLTPPPTIRLWIQQQEHHLSEKMWCWKTDKLAEWVLSQREQQLSVSEDTLLKTARGALGVDSKPVDCYRWSVDFLLRHELSMQSIHMDSIQHPRRLPRNIRDNSRAFIDLLSAQILSKAPHLVASMDEFFVFIDLEQFSNQNPAAFQLSGSSEDKPMFTIVLSALSDGTFLPPLLFYRGAPSHVPEGFPDNILLEARPGGFTDQDCHRAWINRVWRPHVGSQSESLLIVDVHRSHLTEEFRSSLSSMSTNVLFIPSGCSCRLQPLDVCVTPVLRDFLQARWSQLVSQGGLDGLRLDQLALTLACWLSEVSSTLNSDTDFLRRSFASVCNLQEVEERGEAARMIQALTEALVQPLQTCGPQPDSEPQLELLMLREEQQEEEMEKEQSFLERSPAALRLMFDGDSDQETFYGFHDE